ncbi:hypothetical protein [Pedobacter sp. MC2016-24]|uniref:hypothetical protein n=1 Tax=Pedobacter sp. MC2016-24 TaxID=2780090 RepID=UPI0018810029|nr:hypothetical protein [Pedobacter sp. MC2016-24]MBE9601516.1 hypothetical protein [Pedobacter sp. MC2016-24]
MKRNNPSEEEAEDKLPFSFRKKEVSSEKIEKHWQRIVAQIAGKNDYTESDKIETLKTRSVKLR